VRRDLGEADYAFTKWLVDVTLSAAGLVLLAPLMLLIAALIWYRSGWPVLIAQERLGCGARRFRLFKFRTLPFSNLVSRDRQWTASPDDSWGMFLRRTGLDELPQLVNVLIGDMSLVGPRPERPFFVEQFQREVPSYAMRHRLQCGITGWAQVNGWRGDTSIARRIEYDLYYLHHWSLRFDMRILWMTLKNLVSQLWAHASDPAGAPHARPV
jgi:lipopolysaccharide/colanic/teichoic acid biosynthesis glycosyltransferase